MAGERARRVRALRALRRDGRGRARRDPRHAGRTRPTRRPAAADAGRAPPATRSTARCGTTRPSAPAHRRAGLAGLAAAANRRPPAYTISLDSAGGDGRKAAARRAQHAAPEAQARRRRRCRRACARSAPRVPPRASIADANEAWTPALLPSLMAVAAETGVELIEQPLPAGADAALEGARPFPSAPTKSLHDRAGLARSRRALRCRQHQARQGRRPHRGAGTGRGGPRSAASRSWSAAWCRPRSPWRRPCCSPRAPTGSTSTVRCCWRATAIPPCATTALSCIPPEARLWG